MIALDLCQAHYLNFVDNVSGALYNNMCINCKSFLDYMVFKYDQLIFRCFEYKKNYMRDFNKDLMKRFASTHGFCNEDINKFILILRKAVFPNEYMNSWERLNEKLLPEKVVFYNSLNMEDIADVDY